MLVCSPSSTSRTTRRFVISCGGNRSKRETKKPKKADLADNAKIQESKSEEAAPSSPPRILETGSRSLKSQLRYVRQAQADKAAPSTKFRKRRERTESAPVLGAQAIRPKRILKPDPPKPAEVTPKTPEEIAEEEAKQRAIARSKKIASLYQRSLLKGTPGALLIDGYNIMYQWLEEPGQRRLKGRLGLEFNYIREAFLREVSAYSSKDLRVMVAFDAMGNLGSSAPIVREVFGGIEIVFVGSAEADAFIAQEAHNLRKSGCPYVLVASNDHDVSESCWSNEIFPMNSSQLLHEIKKEKRAYKRQQAEKAYQANGQDLGSRMMAASPQLYMELERMRRGKGPRT